MRVIVRALLALAGALTPLVPFWDGISWVKSSLSFANGNCVEATRVLGHVAVRDSKDPRGGTLVFTAAAWRRYTRALQEAPGTVTAAGGLRLS